MIVPDIIRFASPIRTIGTFEVTPNGTFSSELDGCNAVIKDVEINAPASDFSVYALFGSISASSKIKNLTIDGLYSHNPANSGAAAGLVGNLRDAAQVSESFAKTQLVVLNPTDDLRFGGLVGTTGMGWVLHSWISSTIINSYANTIALGLPDMSLSTTACLVGSGRPTESQPAIALATYCRGILPEGAYALAGESLQYGIPLGQAAQTRYSYFDVELAAFLHAGTATGLNPDEFQNQANFPYWNLVDQAWEFSNDDYPRLTSNKYD